MRKYIRFAGRPIAAVSDVTAATPTIRAVHVDHLDRPVAMTDPAGTTVWRAYYKPFGEVQAVTGPAALDARFPGQWFMAEAGLAYNWHRWYDASLGRYTQPDPLGLVDGPSRYAYAHNSPLRFTDTTGLQVAEGAAVGTAVGGPGFGTAVGAAGGVAAALCLASPTCRKAVGKAAKNFLDACLVGEDEEHRRCGEVLKTCREQCTDSFVDSPGQLPGVGSDMPGRMRRCIRECMQDNNCHDF